ncbi:hypothetical protein [Schnuerera sp.]|uniref:hypothetical protein n=1 Tax=Schnuerera sp. TaxID=2794844 RepID=UPI002B56CE86|nr:hypothetical protein [Schnuerera sp.]HSH36118.1 hypothetical protein [Schnuerera sp.]
MKKILLSFIILTLTLIAIGCSYTDEGHISALEKKIEEEPLSYKIEKIALSKGFQTTESNVEILDKTKNLKLQANIGLIESSGISIEKITKSDKTINIYINRLLDQGEIQLAVPQVVLEILEPIDENIEDLKFNIVTQNFDLISLKYSKNQILDRIYTEFKIEPNSIPDVKLTKLKDQIHWHVSFTNIFDKENSKSPLFNLNVKVDALTGEILDSVKDIISAYIDDGYLLDYIPNNYILYKRYHEENGIWYESLWTYNVINGQRGKLYTSKDNIQSAVFSPNGEYVSTIEVDENKSDIYLISRQEKIPYKITPNTFLYPKLMKWKDDKTLYFVDIKDETSTLLAYDIHENKSVEIMKVDKIMDSFDLLENKLIFTETQEYSANKNIYFYQEGAELKEIGSGSKVSFLDKENIIYLENVEEKNKNILHIYNIVKNTYENKFDQNIANYFKLDENNLIFIEKNTSNSDYTIKKFNMDNENLISIANVNNDKIFYDPEMEKGYINLCPPNEDDHLNIIYSIDFNKFDIANIKN